MCDTPGPFGHDPASCFQLRNHGLKVRRRYDEYLGAVDGATSRPGCWFRTSASQPMRNLALAGVLRIRDNVDAFYALCAPAGNRAIWRRWDEARDVLPTFLMHDLPAEHILAHHTPNDANALRARYLLEPPAHHLVATDKEWQTWQLVATDPPGGVADLDLTSLPRR